MRDRHFVLWLVGLIVAPLILEKFSTHTSLFVYGAVIVLAGLGTAGLVWLGYRGYRVWSENRQWRRRRRSQIGAAT